MKYQILLLLKAGPKWLGLSASYREKIFTEFVYPLFLKFTEALKIQLFNSEAFHAAVSDIINIETENLEEYYRFIKELKSSRIFSEGYFELSDTIVGIENGFRKFNEAATKEKNFSEN